jgi:hypothetical protein
LFAIFLMVLQTFSSCLACVLLFFILLTCCFQLVWQLYIISQRIWGYISSNFDETVIKKGNIKVIHVLN